MYKFDFVGCSIGLVWVDCEDEFKGWFFGVGIVVGKWNLVDVMVVSFVWLVIVVVEENIVFIVYSY